MLDTTAKGNYSEAMLIAAFVRRGYIVLLPVGEQHRYDFAVDRDGDLLRIEAKTGRVREGCVVFRTCTYGRTSESLRDYRGVADLFGVYVPELDACYLVPVDICPSREARLRLEPRQSHSGRPVKDAAEFLL